jgi:hypothetical protein
LIIFQFLLVLNPSPASSCIAQPLSVPWPPPLQEEAGEGFKTSKNWKMINSSRV